MKLGVSGLYIYRGGSEKKSPMPPVFCGWGGGRWLRSTADPVRNT